MDKLYNTQRETVQQISVEHTRKVLGGSIGLMFYDVTSLYFETGVQDELRTNGFSKDGKTAESQIILGLLVSADGYPLSYSVFNGAQYEGRTMIPVIDDFIRRFNIKDFVIVADSGLLNKTNVELLRQAGYKYILGARIKKEPAKVIEGSSRRRKLLGRTMSTHVRTGSGWYWATQSSGRRKTRTTATKALRDCARHTAAACSPRPPLTSVATTSSCPSARTCKWSSTSRR